MRIIISYPPNIDQIRKFFTLHKGIVFTYGDILYNPDNGFIDEALMVHEETHQRQQAEMGVEKWWALYLASADFRVSQEVSAYQNQFREQKKHIKDRNRLNSFLVSIAHALSGKMYGNVLSFSEALQAIKSLKPIVFDLTKADVL